MNKKIKNILNGIQQLCINDDKPNIIKKLILKHISSLTILDIANFAWLSSESGNLNTSRMFIQDEDLSSIGDLQNYKSLVITSVLVGSIKSGRGYKIFENMNLSGADWEKVFIACLDSRSLDQASSLIQENKILKTQTIEKELNIYPLKHQILGESTHNKNLEIECHWLKMQFLEKSFKENLTSKLTNKI